MREYELIRTSIEQFEAGGASLERLITDLDSAWNNLARTAEPTWRKELRRQWAVLEEVYAVCLDEGRDHLEKVEQQLVEKTVENLKALVSKPRIA